MQLKISSYLILFLSFKLFAAIDPSILDRVKPFGAVRVEGQSAEQELNIKQITIKKARTGEEVYQQHCTVCHASGVAGAPRFQHHNDWEPRLKSKNLQVLLKEVTTGYKAMPPMGTCQECSEDELKKAIAYMLPR
ncbi:MAG: hypothetical protein A3F18_07130 [Legionellales bacterium RIFCSPHIGHO2_12_FULL_37_14]|nr:MAG: hypothetical protein A3F18_07130 [Legionellales bacterium RIFCSPHIGHO2_12_FULL_37_14]